MSAIRGTIRNGQVVLDEPADLPDGTRVTVGREPIELMTEDEQGDDPESIAAWIAWAESVQPLILTPEDEERIRQARADQKAWELANWEAHSKKIEDLFR
jgi:hypothetical protein